MKLLEQIWRFSLSALCFGLYTSWVLILMRRSLQSDSLIFVLGLGNHFKFRVAQDFEPALVLLKINLRKFAFFRWCSPYLQVVDFQMIQASQVRSRNFLKVVYWWFLLLSQTKNISVVIYFHHHLHSFPPTPYSKFSQILDPKPLNAPKNNPFLLPTHKTPSITSTNRLNNFLSISPLIAL